MSASDRGTRWVPLLCAAMAATLGLLVASAAAHGQGVTLLVHMSAGEPVAQLVHPPFSFVSRGAHYDGVYYYAVARDPLARGQAHQLLDNASYRYGHPGYGWLAWIASGGGRPAAVPYALLMMSVLGLAVAGAAASVLARDLGMSPWWGLSVALNPGLLFVVTVDASETVGLAFALLAVLAWTRERWLLAGLAIAAGCFTKEPLILVPVALVVWEGVEWARRGRPLELLQRIGAIVAGPVLYAIWVAYVGWVFTIFPFEQIHQVVAPPSGWLDTLKRAAGFTVAGVEPQVSMVTPALLVSLAGLLVLGLAKAVRCRHPLDPIFVLMAIIAFSSNWLVLLFPKDLLRTVAIPLALLPFVIGGSERVTTAAREPEPESPPAAQGAES